MDFVQQNLMWVALAAISGGMLLAQMRQRYIRDLGDAALRA